MRSKRYVNRMNAERLDVLEPTCCAPISQRVRRRCGALADHEHGGKPFCSHHSPAWKAHYEIVERIRAL